MRISELIAGLDIRVRTAPRAAVPEIDVRICDLTEDSRTVMPGSMFIARAGTKSDGRRFVDDAVKSGAVAILTDDAQLAEPRFTNHALHSDPTIHPPLVLVTSDINAVTARLAERFFGEPSSKLSLIGVTGTNGKTTTTFLMHQMLNLLGRRAGLIGTVVIDDGVEVAPANMTTPPALEVSRTLARMLEAGCSAAVMEVSSHSLHQHRVGALRFASAAFTNLTGDHLDYHGTMDAYAAAKARLFEMLPEGAPAVVNVQSPYHTRMLQATKGRAIGCAQLGHGHESIFPHTLPFWSARVLATGTTCTDVEIALPLDGPLTGTPRRVRIPLVGDFNVMNALQALVTLQATFRDIPLDHFLEVLSRVHPPAGRLEPVSQEGSPFSVFVDYAHTDDALATVLKTLRSAMARRVQAKANQPEVTGSAGKLWCVFGCGGDRDRTKRPRMGKVAAELADQLVITSDNPRTESAMSIIQEIQAGLPRGIAPDQRVCIEPDRDLAIRLAIKNALPGDVVCIAGKGHEDYQIFADPARPGSTMSHHFDDREVARAALTARGINPRPASRTGREPGHEILGDAARESSGDELTATGERARSDAELFGMFDLRELDADPDTNASSELPARTDQ